MRVKFIKKINEYYTEYEALEDGIIIFDSGDLPAFTKEAESLPIYIKKNQHFQLSKLYHLKNSLQIEELEK